MKTKKLFSFDELKDAEKIISTGMPNGIDYSQMYLIAKYFRETYGYGAIKLERELISFCKQQDKNFNPVTEAASIKKWIRVAMSYGLRKIDGIFVSNPEIEFLKTIQTTKDRKLLFATLVFAKVLKKNSHSTKTSENYYIRYSNFLDIIRTTKLSGVTEVDFADILHKHKQHFTFYNPEKELIRLEFVDKMPESMFMIDNLESIDGYYEMIFGERKQIGVCEICKKPFVKNANAQKMCLSCKKEKRNEQQKELMRERRKVLAK